MPVALDVGWETRVGKDVGFFAGAFTDEDAASAAGTASGLSIAPFEGLGRRTSRFTGTGGGVLPIGFGSGGSFSSLDTGSRSRHSLSNGQSVQSQDPFQCRNRPGFHHWGR